MYNSLSGGIHSFLIVCSSESVRRWRNKTSLIFDALNVISFFVCFFCPSLSKLEWKIRLQISHHQEFWRSTCISSNHRQKYISYGHWKFLYKVSSISQWLNVFERSGDKVRKWVLKFFTFHRNILITSPRLNGTATWPWNELDNP